jgi:20S proteasome subunit alpha 6
LKLIVYIAPLEELVRHGLQALRDTLQQDKELNINNTSLGIVGDGHAFEIVEGDALQRYLDLLGEDTGRTRAAGHGPRSSAPSNDDDEPSEPAAAVLFEAADPMDTDH